METQGRCSLCSRDFDRHHLRRSKDPGHGGTYLCQPCWSVICPQPWPADDSAHGGQHGVSHGGGRPDLAQQQQQQQQQQPTHQSPFAEYKDHQHQHGDPHSAAAHHHHHHQQSAMQRRSYSMANIPQLHNSLPGGGGLGGGSHSMAVPAAGRQGAPRYPSSMPEQPVLLSASGDDPRWGALAASAHVAGSAPAWRQSSLAAAAAAPAPAPAPPTFSPQELRNMMDEQSLELFESQSHLLDPNSRMALHRQRQYLQWQNSVGEAGPMQSVLERQDSAGSGCDRDGNAGGSAAAAMAAAAAVTMANGNAANGHAAGDAAGAGLQTGGSGATDDSSGGASLMHELQESRRHLAMIQRERESLATRVQQLESELEAQRESTLCKMCRQTPRNCVVLPCLHFTSCDNCFKKHCASTLSCPMCHARVTGFQTLLVL